MLILTRQINSLQAAYYLTTDKEEKLSLESQINDLRGKLWEITETISMNEEYQIN